MRKVKRNISSANPKNVGARNIALQRPAILAKNQGPNASMPELTYQTHQHSQEYLIGSANNTSGQNHLPDQNQYGTVLHNNLMNTNSAIGSIQNFEFNDNARRSSSNNPIKPDNSNQEPTSYGQALQDLKSLTLQENE